MREVDTLLEPFSRRQATSAAHVSRVRAVPGGETDLWLEPARADEPADGREPRVYLPSLDSGHGVLGNPGALAHFGLGQAGPGPGEIDEVAAVHWPSVAQKCTSRYEPRAITLNLPAYASHRAGSESRNSSSGILAADEQRPLGRVLLGERRQPWQRVLAALPALSKFAQFVE